jgi:hypothetical protein
MMETGITRQTRLDVAILLAEALDVSPRYLAFGNGGPVVRKLGKAP